MKHSEAVNISSSKNVGEGEHRLLNSQQRGFQGSPDWWSTSMRDLTKPQLSESAQQPLSEKRSLQVAAVCSRRVTPTNHWSSETPKQAATGLHDPPGLQHAPTAVTLPGWLVPVIPVEELEVFVVWNVYLINLPGALVIRQIFPLDQVMNVSLFIKAIIHTT